MSDLPDIETLLVELNTAARGVAQASTKLAALTKEFENHVTPEGEVELGVGARYQIAFEAELVDIYENADNRPPPSDIREAMAYQRVRAKHPALVAEHGRITTEMKALQQWISANKAVINARQSILNGARAIGA